MNIRHRRLNGWRRLALMPVLLLAVLLLVLASSFAFRGTAHAQSGDTFTMASTAVLIARTTIQISVTASCTIPSDATFLADQVQVSITQASGRVITQAVTAGILPPCDETVQTLQLFLTPQAGSAPFHGGLPLAR